MDSFKKTVFSSIQPTSQLTLGNYIGSLSKWSSMQNSYNCIYCISDLHSMTIRNYSSSLQNRVFDTLALYLSCGIDPNKSIIFVQSYVKEHTELQWILNCYTYFGELIRMTQFKNKSMQNSSNINAGLLNYPILMASDILLYQSNIVPIGEDQIQHLELVSRIAKRFNKIYGKVFTIPNFLIPNCGSRIMSLLNPNKKMSKSDNNVNNVIFLLDDIKIIHNKIHKAVTDSDFPPRIIYNPIIKPGISNLLEIFSCITDKEINYLENIFKGKSYCYFKKSLINAITSKINKLQKKFYFYRRNEKYLKKIINSGANAAKIIAKKTLTKVFNAIN
ncbi:tryptophan--tRNA ligase [Buchnera aphidicola (Neophyllaphis varicolor)]|uniref:tryptophan--tRNA ligase n=1 Tax=Buchnera aphidicola TaxID=9 RepID=UPI0031B8837D